MSDESVPPKRPLWRRIGRVLVRLFLLFVVVYSIIVLIGLIPVNNDFQQTPDGIEIYVISNAVHSDLVLPLDSDAIDWRELFPASAFAGDVRQATHVAIGWGDRGFFLKTPTWADLKFSVVANALLLPSDTCMHVSMTRSELLGSGARSVSISASEYKQLVDAILESVPIDSNGQPTLIEGAAYGRYDAFFAATGRYHCLNTCNSWVGSVLKRAGVRTPWISPLPKTVYWYFPE